MNAKIYTGNIQPNPKEYKIWVNDEGVIKTWNGTEWIEQSGESGGTASKYAPKYFKIDWNVASVSWKYALCGVGENALTVINIASTIKSKHYITDYDQEYIITTYGISIDSPENIVGFSYLPLYVTSKKLEAVGINSDIELFKDIKDVIPVINVFITDLGEPLSMEGITEITEEEYYKIG